MLFILLAIEIYNFPAFLLYFCTLAEKPFLTDIVRVDCVVQGLVLHCVFVAGKDHRSWGLDSL